MSTPNFPFVEVSTDLIIGRWYYIVEHGRPLTPPTLYKYEGVVEPGYRMPDYWAFHGQKALYVHLGTWGVNQTIYGPIPELFEEVETNNGT